MIPSRARSAAMAVVLGVVSLCEALFGQPVPGRADPPEEIRGPGISKFQAEPRCTIINKELLVVQTIIHAEYKYRKPLSDVIGRSTETVRVLWSLECSLVARSCRGFKMDLNNVDKGARLRFLDVSLPQDLRLASVTDKVLTVQWGSRALFTVDLGLARIAFSESSQNVEGRGSGLCQPNQHSMHRAAPVPPN